MAQRKRSEWWFVMTYASREEYQPLLDNCQHYALCVHDKDIKDDGTPHETHTHILVKFEGSKSIEQIKTLVNSSQNTFGECQKKVGDKWIDLNKTACYRYLLHLDNKEKYQYDESERLTDDDTWWIKYTEHKNPFDNPTEDTFYEDLIAPYESSYDYMNKMSLKYGRDFIKNFNSYNTFRARMWIDELEHESAQAVKLDPNIRRLISRMDDMGYSVDEIVELMEKDFQANRHYERLYKQLKQTEHNFKQRLIK